MTRRSSACALCAALVVAAPARAQLGELQVGAIAGYGTGQAYGPGAGLVLGLAAGRLAYVGLRWTYHMGTTQVRGPGLSEVRTRGQVFAADLGVQIPAGALEIVPFVSVGMNQFTQSASQPNASGNSREFLGAPGLAVEMRVARIAVIPEIQYYFAGAPDLPWRVRHRGLTAAVRLVFLSEVRRIRR